MTRFTDEDLTFFDNQAHMFTELNPGWRDWCPFESMPYKRKAEWKVLEKIRDAAASLDGSRTSRAATTYTFDEAPLIWLSHHFEWTEAEVIMARDVGNNIQTDEIMLSGRRINQQDERLILNGTMGWEAPDISGLLATATDVGGTTAVDGIPWDTEGNPYLHAKAAYGVMNDNDFIGPYKWLLGTNLRPGIAAKDSTEGPSSRVRITDSFEVESFHFLDIVATGGAYAPNDLTCKPLPAPIGDDSRWAFIKPKKNGRNNFAVLEVFAPTLTVVPDMDVKRRVFYGRYDHFLTLKKVHDNSVVDEDQVDLVT